jgi:phosphate:Na+ symporter
MSQLALTSQLALMPLLKSIVSLAGGLCLFLYGVKVMSEAVQQVAGSRLQKALNFMTGNRFIAVLTGAVVTTMVQSSSAVTVMLVSFVNAGLLSLVQAIGVIFGSNIGTTTTAWLVSLVGFSFNIAALALPAFALGFILLNVKWKHQNLGNVFIGFSFIFLGLEFLTQGLPKVRPEQVSFIGVLASKGFLSLIIGLLAGAVVTLLMHSSAATITLVISLAYGKILPYEMSAAMILGANIGTTIDAILASLGGRPAAKQTALVHVLFNVLGSVIILIFFKPFLLLVNLCVGKANVAMHLAMFHSLFNLVCTIVFLPFVQQFALLAKFFIKDEKADSTSKQPETYRFDYQPSIFKSPELAMLRAEKEIRDMAGLASSLCTRIRRDLPLTQDEKKNAAMVAELRDWMKEREEYAGEMREELTAFFLELPRYEISPKTEHDVSLLLSIINALDEAVGQCLGISLLMEKSVRKNRIIKTKEMQALDPFIAMVEEFLIHVQRALLLQRSPDAAAKADGKDYAEKLENKIDKARNKLRKRSRKRIEAGKDVKTELLFTDLVKRIEALGDNCYSISRALNRMRR